MKGNTSSPAITRVTAGDAFSPPRLPTARTPAPSAANCRLAKPYLLHAKSIPFARQNHTFGHAKPYVSQTRHAHTACEAAAMASQGRLAETRKRKRRKEQKAPTGFPSTLYRSRKNLLPFKKHTLCRSAKARFASQNGAMLGRAFSLCPSANTPPQSPNLFTTQKREPQSPLFRLSS